MHTERFLAQRLPSPGGRRIVVLTGARQTGKTTLARKVYSGLRYLNLDAVELRELVRNVSTLRWGEEIGAAVLDEAQKEPGVFDKVKYAYDEGTLDFSVLLGSSRILLLDRVRESLAGRAFVYELWPLMASELASSEGGDPPLMDALLRDLETFEDKLLQQPPEVVDSQAERARAAIEHLAAWGGMPALLPLTEEERREWLSSYQQTYLERDLADLATLSDLLPFRALQRLAMLRTGGLLNYASLARDAGLSASTARRYVEYLRLTYQAVLLPPYRSNLASRVVKAPKLHWVDLGLLRQATRQWGPLTGELFETLVVAEVMKWVSTRALPVDLSFYRTRSGLEIDLLAESGGKVLGFEMKLRRKLSGGEHRSLVRLADDLGDAWAGGLVVTSGNRIACLDAPRRIWAVPAHRLLC
ncbi:MAG: ATP-binding protein [Acidobacteria bacterium]|nr:ATP-binding protein [Acidobacteriota bacterium]